VFRAHHPTVAVYLLPGNDDWAAKRRLSSVSPERQT